MTDTAELRDAFAMITVVHIDADGARWICRADERTGAGAERSMFPKWWCCRCKRYVLPDGRKHWSLLPAEVQEPDQPHVADRELLPRHGEPIP